VDAAADCDEISGSCLLPRPEDKDKQDKSPTCTCNLHLRLSYLWLLLACLLIYLLACLPLYYVTGIGTDTGAGPDAICEWPSDQLQ
jgi:hypothetical protein